MYCRAAIPLLLVAASLGHAAAAPETVTESDSGKTVTIAPHQLLRIKLDEAPDGGLGSVCFRYVGNAAGRTKLRLGEFQFGRRSSKPADSFRVTVRVR